MARGTRRAALALFLAFAFAPSRPASAQIVTDREPWRPPPFKPTATCEVWTGSGSGNDPSLLIEMLLCKTGDRVIGRTQYSGKNSGWSVRSLEGEALDGGGGFDLHEKAITEQKPNPGWRFCTVDRYALTGSTESKRLEGTYDSDACHDHGNVAMHLTETIVQPGTGEPRPTKAPVAAGDVPASTPGSKAKGSCGCRQAPVDAGAWPLVLFALLGAWGRRSARRRGRTGTRAA